MLFKGFNSGIDSNNEGELNDFLSGLEADFDTLLVLDNGCFSDRLKKIGKRSSLKQRGVSNGLLLAARTDTLKVSG